MWASKAGYKRDRFNEALNSRWAGHRHWTGTQPLRRWHAMLGLGLGLGLGLLVGLLFFSATGLTWSRWAGDNIGVARAAPGMSTPSVATALAG